METSSAQPPTATNAPPAPEDSGSVSNVDFAHKAPSSSKSVPKVESEPTHNAKETIDVSTSSKPASEQV